MDSFLLPAMMAAVVSFAVTPLVIQLAKRLQLVDDPRKRTHPAQVHHGIVPRAGGLALLIGFILPLLWFLPLTRTVIGLSAAAIVTVGIGLFDDRKDISPYIRFAANIGIALLIVLSGIDIPFITNPLGGILRLDMWHLALPVLGEISVWSSLFAILWIVWTMNIVGWSSGVDGQMPGFVVIAATTLGLLSLRFNIHDATQSIVTSLAFITAGTFLGFLPWNFYPQKIMPGYGGKILAGFLLAILGILSYGKMGTALLVLGVPTMDAVYTLLRRLGSKKSPVWADRGHLHHRLLDLGWGKRRVALFYWGVSAILGAVALTVRSQEKLFAFLLVAVALAGFLVWLKYFSQLSKPQDPDSG
ncbi:TPA: hypothetical protein DIV55_06615 [Patescibacteria group bacterium]|nr:hypothetical protein [Patescibacteria group bacterium]